MPPSKDVASYLIAHEKDLKKINELMKICERIEKDVTTLNRLWRLEPYVSDDSDLMDAILWNIPGTSEEKKRMGFDRLALLRVIHIAQCLKEGLEKKTLEIVKEGMDQ